MGHKIHFETSGYAWSRLCSAPLYAFIVRTVTTLPLPLPRVTTVSKDQAV